MDRSRIHQHVTLPLDDWPRLKEVFAGARALRADDRPSYLAAACGGNETLRREVESLLWSDERAKSFLEAPAVVRGDNARDQARLMMEGQRLGVYQVQALLGAGGMGEVYRARDTKLERDVAVKFLPHAFTSDPERLARFEREARMLAALNHQNIGAIYGFEEAEGIRFLVLELVDGQTLADTLADVSRQRSQGPGLPIREALSIARQIAEALDIAHEKGIIHRDLKPANIKITPDGVVKVLDFGLAKAAGDGSMPDLTHSPTKTVNHTSDGAVMGTPGYMSPEQARGQVVDKRTDIWAFGCVLYEMLTGRVAFKGVSDTIVAVLGSEPEWDALPDGTPVSVRLLLQRCLEKDPKRRLRDLGDVRFGIDEEGSHAAPGALESSPGHRAVLPIVLTFVLLVSGAALFYLAKPTVPVTSPSEYTQLTNFADSAAAPSLSPDGRMVTFKRGADSFLGAGQIFVKLLPDGESVQLTTSAGRKYGPVFTPDGSRVAYTEVTSGSWDTWTVPVLGGQPVRLLPNASGLTWIADHLVLFSEIKSGLHMGIVTATDGRAESREIYIQPDEHAMAHYSYASPDRRSVLVVEMNGAHAFTQPCRLVPFDGSSAGRQVGPQGTCTSAAWSPDGRWMYFGAVVEGSSHLWRQKFPDGAPEQITFGPTEEEGIALAPDGRSVVTSVGMRRSAVWMHDAAGERAIVSEGYASAPRLSRDGTRVFYLFARDWWLAASGWLTASADLRSVDLASGKSDIVLSGQSVTAYVISRDEKDVAFTTMDAGGELQLWLAPLDRRTPPRLIARAVDQVSFGAAGELIFRSPRENNALVRIKTDGTGRERIPTVSVLEKGEVSPDGEWVIIRAPGTSAPGSDKDAVLATLAVPLHGGVPRKVCYTCSAAWSPDGRFFYVGSDRSAFATSAGKTLAIPVPAGKSLPDLPAAGISVADGAVGLPGTLTIEDGLILPGPDSSTYLFTRTDSQRNLFRIPLH
jgi:serine/threonine protein kinase/Tol biopolymer transport system component